MSRSRTELVHELAKLKKDPTFDADKVAAESETDFIDVIHADLEEMRAGKDDPEHVIYMKQEDDGTFKLTYYGYEPFYCNTLKEAETVLQIWGVLIKED